MRSNSWPVILWYEVRIDRNSLDQKTQAHITPINQKTIKRVFSTRPKETACLDLLANSSPLYTWEMTRQKSATLEYLIYIWHRNSLDQKTQTHFNESQTFSLWKAELWRSYDSTKDLLGSSPPLYGWPDQTVFTMRWFSFCLRKNVYTVLSFT